MNKNHPGEEFVEECGIGCGCEAGTCKVSTAPDNDDWLDDVEEVKASTLECNPYEECESCAV